MMTELLLLVGKLNLAMGAAIIMVCLLRRPVRAQFGALIAYALWLLVPIAGLASLLPPRTAAPLPVNFTPMLFTPAQIPAGSISATTQIVHSAGCFAGHLAAQSAPAMIATAWGVLDYAALLFTVWALGAMLMALYLVRLQLRFHAAARLGEAGPAVLGFFRPRIVTPDSFQEHFTLQEQTAILAHERAHLARQDARINAVTALLRCLCWFNPLVHLGAVWMRMDQELACDSAALRGPVSRHAYASALLKSQMTATALPLGCDWPGSEHPLIERIALLKRKPPGKARRITGTGLVLFAATFAGLGAWAVQPPVAAKPRAARQLGVALATLPAIVAASGRAAGDTGPNQPVANANPSSSGNDVDVSRNVRANRAVATAPAPASAQAPSTGSIEARTESAIAALPQIAPVSGQSNKITADQLTLPTSQDASPEPKNTVTHKTAAGPARREVTAVASATGAPSAAASGQRPRTEPTLQCLLGLGPKWCGRNDGCNGGDGPLERVDYLGTNAAGADVYEAQYLQADRAYVIAPPGPDGKSRIWTKRGNPNGIIPNSLVHVTSRTVPALIYTRSPNSPAAGCVFVPGNTEPEGPSNAKP
jgi:beta-lactamase regulating signal transducer with metallopeptidase domain